MNLDEYQSFTGTTAKYPEELKLMYTALGLAGEAGEYCDGVKKIFRDDGGEITEEKKAALIKELGDVIWYVSEAARSLGVPLSEVARVNVDKLSSRKERGVIGGSGDDR